MPGAPTDHQQLWTTTVNFVPQREQAEADCEEDEVEWAGPERRPARPHLPHLAHAHHIDHAEHAWSVPEHLAIPRAKYRGVSGRGGRVVLMLCSGVILILTVSQATFSGWGSFVTVIKIF